MIQRRCPRCHLSTWCCNLNGKRRVWCVACRGIRRQATQRKRRARQAALPPPRKQRYVTGLRRG